jgi:hypothetical protein
MCVYALVKNFSFCPSKGIPTKNVQTRFALMCPPSKKEFMPLLSVAE